MYPNPNGNPAASIIVLKNNEYDNVYLFIHSPFFYDTPVSKTRSLGHYRHLHITIRGSVIEVEIYNVRIV